MSIVPSAEYEQGMEFYLLGEERMNLLCYSGEFICIAVGKDCESLFTLPEEVMPLCGDSRNEAASELSQILQALMFGIRPTTCS
jgi:hypothetical protein